MQEKVRYALFQLDTQGYSETEPHSSAHATKGNRDNLGMFFNILHKKPSTEPFLQRYFFGN